MWLSRLWAFLGLFGSQLVSLIKDKNLLCLNSLCKSCLKNPQSMITLYLERNRIDSTGAYGLLRDQNQNLIALTLEHSYPDNDDAWAPKIPSGMFTCVRGQHRLASMNTPFITFEIQVPNHTNILFHCGNTENDSEGCVLLGTRLDKNILLESRIAFNKFMFLMMDISEFQLLVS